MNEILVKCHDSEVKEIVLNTTVRPYHLSPPKRFMFDARNLICSKLELNASQCFWSQIKLWHLICRRLNKWEIDEVIVGFRWAIQSPAGVFIASKLHDKDIIVLRHFTGNFQAGVDYIE